MLFLAVNFYYFLFFLQYQFLFVGISFQEIDAIEKLKKGNLESQRKIIGSLLLYSVLLYIIAALVFYFYYLPTEWQDRVKYSAPLLVFPLM